MKNNIIPTPSERTQIRELRGKYPVSIDEAFINTDTPGKDRKIFEIVLDEAWRPNEGIFHQIEKRNSINYTGKVDITLIEKFVKNLTKSKVRNDITLRVSIEGGFRFNWLMTFGDTITVKYYRAEFGKIPGYYLSLFKKHGEYKLFAAGNILKIYKGTVLIKEFPNIYSMYYLNNEVFSEQMIPIVKGSIKEINNYLKILEDGNK